MLAGNRIIGDEESWAAARQLGVSVPVFAQTAIIFIIFVPLAAVNVDGYPKLSMFYGTALAGVFMVGMMTYLVVSAIARQTHKPNIW